ncbi:hypothetical protein Ddye_009385 [Dipteronia dyeriana]|uniref:HAT C-terminal dimerisation domain-containing protein n=1 Tax=Dipteronia dyeriana TaxID=168575 RepID=A0AAD9XCA1_9ROSI|nr:hypothetical protein Ddye_009385 [Dipteronia dyeriana]
MNNGLNNSIRGEAKGVLQAMRTFEFVFILQLMNEVLGITHMLCQALQSKSQDILNAMHLIRSTKILLQELRQDGWDKFLCTVLSFCGDHEIGMPDMSARYREGTCRSCQQQNNITIEHYYHFNIFNVVIDFQLMELDNRFPDQTMELLALSSTLDPTNHFESFNIDDICTLAKKFYPGDFTERELSNLKRQLQYFKNDVLVHPKFQNMSSLSELCRGVVETRKTQLFFFIDRLIRLVLTLPVSTASTERAFSAMKLVKTSLRNKMDDDFLANCLVIYIERELADTIDSESIIDIFYALKPRSAPLQ